jgi:hypothetical protein
LWTRHRRVPGMNAASGSVSRRLVRMTLGPFARGPPSRGLPGLSSSARIASGRVCGPCRPALNPADCRHDAPALCRVPTPGSGCDVPRSRG